MQSRSSKTTPRESAALRASRNRRENLLRFVRKHYGSKSNESLSEFKKDLKNKLLADPKLARESNANRAAISRALSSRTAQSLSYEKAGLLEKLFKMEPEYLSREREKKAPAYVLLQCRANTAEKLATQIFKAPLVDEVAVIIGDSDLFVRLFGTQEDIKLFLLNELFDIAAGVAQTIPDLLPGTPIIDRTKTYLSFDHCYFLRHHPKNNSEFSDSE